MIFYQLFEPESSTYTYILGDKSTREAVIIDPVLETVERDLKLLSDLDLKLTIILETHVHADHITGASQLKKKTGAKTMLAKASGVECADRLLVDGDELKLGSQSIKVLATPGHTDSCMSYLMDGKVFTGDALLIRATGRTDFQQGSSEKLYQSIQQKLFVLPDDTEIYPAHDYKGISKTTVGQEKKLNPRIGNGKTEAEFVKIMADLKLTYPKKIDMALPANMKCGEMNV